MSALDYDQAVDRQISRWRQIQHQVEMQRMASEKAQADQLEKEGEQQVNHFQQAEQETLETEQN